ncbi:hypothetical protein CJD36_013840 [Flavipsychrobacter stenotrophus]|uniref:Uncharacterized protein n=1 Tax=Flavipsychrobacter stenotrophus TaxID=2077091 RepID=A0A2S7SWZ0_9BACT|nr:histidine kinase [Flavipsychrobacter stenotrophus]PQJ11046.1 hypothetical protein CJD36_013840 [Flavipsychrobacter stenotrophus]
MKSTLATILFAFFVLFCGGALFAQQQQSRNYGMKDGLAGNTIYSVLADNRGFLWFATDGGVSLYDGSTFKNFSVKDGLEDNDVLSMFQDNDGRIWFYCFNKQPCFYYKGQFFNSKNSAELRKIKDYNWHILCIAAHEVWFQGGGNMYRFRDNKVTSFHLPITEGLNIVTEINSVIYIISQTAFYAFNARIGKFEKDNKLIRDNRFDSHIVDAGNGVFLLIDRSADRGAADIYRCVVDPENHTVVTKKCGYLDRQMKNFVVDRTNKRLLVLFADNTAIEKNMTSDTLATLRSYKLPSLASDIATDIQGNKWVTMLAGGVEVFPGNPSTTIAVSGTKGALTCICLLNMDGKIVAGTSENSLVFLDKGRMSNLIHFHQYRDISRVIDVKADKYHRLWVGTDNGICIYDPNKRSFNYVGVANSIKDIKYDSVYDCMLFASSFGSFYIPCDNTKFTATITSERTTCIASNRGINWYATLDNLYNKSGGFFEYKSTLPKVQQQLYNQLGSRITCMEPDAQNRLWVGTSGNGVFVVDNKIILFHFTTESGLTSDICKNLYLDSKGEAWVSTNQGVARITLSGKQFSIVKYNDKNCLPDNNINDVLVVNDTVYVAGGSGITYFSKDRITNRYALPTYITRVKSGPDEFAIADSTMAIKSRHNTISISFSGLSYVSNGDIKYEYFIKELNDKPLVTKNTIVTYSGLGPGTYNFYVSAIDIFGNRSVRPSHITFTILPEWYQQLWLRWLAGLLVVMAVAGITFYYSKIHEKRRRVRSELLQTISRLELEAIQQQIDPHFIFNCLNAIQGVIYKNNTDVASYFINRFAKLMRKGLMLSKETFISVEEEYEFINNYLEVEQLRLNNSFDFTIVVDGSINKSQPLVPAFILHPFIENAINHGIKYLKGERGTINVEFVKTDRMEIRLTDNGIGVNASKKIKEQRLSGHTSKGTELILARVESLNKIYNKDIGVEILDRSDQGPGERGTIVIISFGF